jgi:hypothetical protein
MKCSSLLKSGGPERNRVDLGQLQIGKLHKIQGHRIPQKRRMRLYWYASADDELEAELPLSAAYLQKVL